MVMSILADEVDDCLCAGIVSLAGAATSIIFVATNTSFVPTNVWLLRQNYVCRHKIFLSRVFRDKTFVATSILLSRPKTCFVATKLLRNDATKVSLSRQKYVCHDKRSVATKHSFCRGKRVFI